MLHQLRHTVGPNEVHVWHLLADRLTDTMTLNAVQALLTPNEQTRMNCLRRERDRTLFLLSRVLMRSVLASYLNCACHDLQFAANDYGKPILHPNVGSPGLHFNLTHSRGAVALAVSNGREVGVDIEERLRKVEYLALAERFFANAEWQHLRGLPAAQLAEAFFAIWTLKEAFVKGIGRGLTFPLDAFCFDLEANRLLRFRPLADFVSPDWHFEQFELSDHHCGAVAVHLPAGSEVRIEMRDWQATFVRA